MNVNYQAQKIIQIEDIFLPSSMINIITPFALDKNLGREYNRRMEQIPDGEWVCILDYDCMLLTPNAGVILDAYAKQNPGCLLTCYTNRIHPSSPQLFEGRMSLSANIKQHIEIAQQLEHRSLKTTQVNSTISGFLMLFEKSLWKRFKFGEEMKCLGVDSEFSARLLDAEVPIKIMESLYVFHQYRIMTHHQDKEHLL